MNYRRTTRSNVQPLAPEMPRSNYAYVELMEHLHSLREEQIKSNQLIADLARQIAELKLALLEQKNTGHFTPDEVEKYFDISKRLQQQDRTDKKLGYLKKKEGAKIIYKTEHLQEYFKNEFEEITPKPK